MQDQASSGELQEFIRLAQEGDHEAYAKIYDAFVSPIYRFISSRVDSMLVEDLTAEVFIKAWEKLRTYRVRSKIPFSAWLFTIARNITVDALRRSKPIEELPETIIDEDRLSDPRWTVEHDLNGVELRKALAKLPERDRGVLELAYFGERSNEEIGSILRMSTGSVRVARFRALQRLQSLFPSEFFV
jgi:RNA polymerase sigma-70 factor (ECF subfamily)